MSEHSITFNQQCYDLWADQYDHEPNSTVAVDDRHFPSVWKHLHNQRVLEIGSGTGRHTVRLAELGNDVTGIELSQRMLHIAKRRLKGQTVQWIHADFLSYTGFAIETFDAVVISLVLEHIAGPAIFFQKAGSLLKRGGELFLSEIHPDRIARGTQANFVHAQSGQKVRPASFVHTATDIINAAADANLQLLSEKDFAGDEQLARTHPGWEKYIGRPMVRIWHFYKS